MSDENNLLNNPMNEEQAFKTVLKNLKIPVKQEKIEAEEKYSDFYKDATRGSFFNFTIEGKKIYELFFIKLKEETAKNQNFIVEVNNRPDFKVSHNHVISFNGFKDYQDYIEQKKGEIHAQSFLNEIINREHILQGVDIDKILDDIIKNEIANKININENQKESLIMYIKANFNNNYGVANLLRQEIDTQMSVLNFNNQKLGQIGTKYLAQEIIPTQEGFEIYSKISVGELEPNSNKIIDQYAIMSMTIKVVLDRKSNEWKTSLERAECTLEYGRFSELREKFIEAAFPSFCSDETNAIMRFLYSLIKSITGYDLRGDSFIHEMNQDNQEDEDNSSSFRI